MDFVKRALTFEYLSYIIELPFIELSTLRTIFTMSFILPSFKFNHSLNLTAMHINTRIPVAKKIYAN